MTGRAHDSLAAALAAAVCIGYLRGAQGFQPPLVSDPLGPSAFPIILGWVGLGLSLLLLLQAWRIPAAPGGAAAAFGRLLTPLLLLALLVGYALVLEVAGYALSTFAFVLAAFRLLGEGWGRGGAIAALFSVGFYLLFTRVLNVGLPAGELFRGW